MESDVYLKLARHQDNLPGGLSAAESGAEQRILRLLFTPDDAKLAMALTALPEEPRMIARRARIRPDEAARRLEAMGQKGLLLVARALGQPPRYMAQHHFSRRSFQLCLLRKFLWEAQEPQALTQAGQPGFHALRGSGESGDLSGLQQLYRTLRNRSGPTG